MNIFGVVRHRAAASLCVALLVLGPYARADAKADASPLAPPDTSSPRATAQSFTENVEAAFRPYYLGETQESPLQTPSGLRAVQCLDVSELPPARAERLAQEAVVLLAEILNRVGLPPPAEIPDAKTMSEIPEGGRRAWRVPETALEIVQEEIGIRSTKVRRWGGNRLTIPNAQFAALKLDNYDDTSNLWIRTTTGLRYETTPDQLRFVLAKIRELLAGHPRLTGSPRARLARFGDYSLNVEILAYADTGNWMEWHAIREDVFLHIMDIVVESGSAFAFPSQTTYLARDGGLDAERSQRAEETVRSWRESNTLPFPDLAVEDAELARGKFQFPPAGSIAHQPHAASSSPPEDS